MITTEKGKYAESLVIASLVKRGFSVSIPFSDYRYDLIAEKEGRFSRIQVKYVGAITRRSTVNVVLHSVGRGGRRNYKDNEIDYIVAYYEPAGNYYVIPYEDVKGKSALNIRLNQTKNNQTVGIIDSKKYENRWELLDK